jgi:hypothetical protein
MVLLHELSGHRHYESSYQLTVAKNTSGLNSSFTMADSHQRPTALFRYANQPAQSYQQTSLHRPTLQPKSQSTSNVINRSKANASEPISTSIGSESYATQQVRQRANMILDNHHLLMRYATANDLVCLDLICQFGI